MQHPNHAGAGCVCVCIYIYIYMHVCVLFWCVAFPSLHVLIKEVYLIVECKFVINSFKQIFKKSKLKRVSLINK